MVTSSSLVLGQFPLLVVICYIFGSGFSSNTTGWWLALQEPWIRLTNVRQKSRVTKNTCVYSF